METRLVKIQFENFELNNTAFETAGEIIRSGGLVAFPTETVYGLGADAFNPDAVKKIYEVKGRPSDNPLIIHVLGIEELRNLVSEIPENAEKLIKRFWPGPLTIVLKKNDSVPYSTTGGLDTVAVRAPKNIVARELIKFSGVPIAAPSANSSGKPSPTRASHVEFDLNGKIEMIIDGGASEFGLESTIIDISGDVPCLLRPGSITLHMLEEVIGSIEVDKAILDKLADNEVTKAPGMKYKHYSPQANVTIVRGSADKVCCKIIDLAEKSKNGKIGVLATEETKDYYLNNGKFYKVLVVGKRSEPETIANNLFKMLRKCDFYEIDEVFTEAFDESELGFAIMNRLNKAAGYKVINV